MPIYLLTTFLLIVTSVTNVTVEGLKKILDDLDVKYSSNLLAAVTSTILSITIGIMYMITNDISFTMKVGVDIIVLTYLGFLTSTLGYDKIVQMIDQIRNHDDE